MHNPLLLDQAGNPEKQRHKGIIIINYNINITLPVSTSHEQITADSISKM